MAYYDGSKILSLKDKNGKNPEIYIVCGNRSSGKTTFFNRYCVRRYINQGEKFALLYRYSYELDGVADKFFKDVQGLFFPEYKMSSEKRARGIYHELILEFPNGEKKSCGYALSINSADQIKKYSHYFSDVSRFLFDEFQSDTGKYCPHEVVKFQSIHTSVARGGGQQSRYVPVIMLSNSDSLINPYFVALDISRRLDEKTKFLRGDGFVLEQNYNETAAAAVSSSAFARAFSNSSYFASAANNRYLSDNNAFVSKMPENGRYLVTLKYAGCEYSIKQYDAEGILYVSDSVDSSFPVRLSVDVNDHNINYMLLSSHDTAISQYRDWFNHGCVRFKNLLCKNAFLALISYKVL